MEKEISAIIVTKSSKRGAYCVAGHLIETGKWVRFVSSDEKSHGALTDGHLMYEDGGCVKIFDAVRVPVISALPLPTQPENVLIDERRRWKKLGALKPESFLTYHPPEQNGILFGNMLPYVSRKQISKIGRSLTMVLVKDLVIFRSNGTKMKASFCYQGWNYRDVAVTDPDFYSVPSGTMYRAANLVVSLPDVPFKNGRYYKFIAKIILL